VVSRAIDPLKSTRNFSSDLEFPIHHHLTRLATRLRLDAMEKLSPEARAMYELLKIDSAEEYERRFLDHRKEVMDAVRIHVDDTTARITADIAANIADVKVSMGDDIASVKASVGADLASVKTSLGGELNSVKSSLSTEIAHLAASVDRVLRANPSLAAATPAGPSEVTPGGTAVGLPRHHSFQDHREIAPVGDTLSLVGGNFSDRTSYVRLQSTADSDHVPFGPCVEIPQFDGANPKLWQRRSEEYFQRWCTPPSLWIAYSTSLFVDDAATWLESYLNMTPQPGWADFVAAVMARFGRNQHQILVRRLFHISQTSAVEDYVRRFAQLVDQIAVYESSCALYHQVS
jgi:hypothetical protein